MKEKLQALWLKLNTGLSTFWSKLNTDISELWQNSKVFVIIFGILIAVIKFHNVLIDLIVSGSKTLFQNTQQKSDSDQDQENKDNQQANQDAQDANNLPNGEAPVNDDWNTKK